MSTKKICIITGANSGIGKEAAAQIAEMGFHVILACRNNTKAAEAAKDILSRHPGVSIESMQVDMGEPASIRAFSNKVKERYPAVDVLIQNAALFNVTQKQRETTADGVETIWAVNHLGPVLLTEMLLDSLQASGAGRIITISSQGLVAMPRLEVSLSDPEFKLRKFSVTKAYYQSKRAQVMYTRWLSDRLSSTSTSANCIRVTAVKVDLARHGDLPRLKRWVYKMKSRMALAPNEMAKTYAWLATSDEVSGVTGKYFNEKNNMVPYTSYERDDKHVEAVMRLTARYIPEVKEVFADVSANVH